MDKLVLKPAVEKIKGGWVGTAGLYDKGFQVASERFNAYNNKQECWNNLIKDAKQFAKKHNTNCGCKTMVVGSY